METWRFQGGLATPSTRRPARLPPRTIRRTSPVTCDPEMGHFECDESDFLLIVCDGVSEGGFPNPEVCQLAAKVLQETNGDADLACEAICHRAVDGRTWSVTLTVGWAGSGAIEMGKSENVNPGSVASCDNSGYTTACVAMRARAGVTFGHAVEMRYNVLLARQGSRGGHGGTGDDRHPGGSRRNRGSQVLVRGMGCRAGGWRRLGRRRGSDCGSLCDGGGRRRWTGGTGADDEDVDGDDAAEGGEQGACPTCPAWGGWKTQSPAAPLSSGTSD